PLRMPLIDGKGESHASACALYAIAKRDAGAHWEPMVNKSPLDDPENAAYAWNRFRQIMRLLAGVTGVTIVVVVGALWMVYPQVSIHFFIAVALGIAMTMGLGGALMSLAFLSNGTGHDEAVDNRLPGADELFGGGDRRN
ncbi:MAG: hypothetical protein AAFZ11_04975, partial [Pseudomonadota bacterium]